MTRIQPSRGATLALFALLLTILAPAPPAAAQGCSVDENTMCLGEGGRFQVSATWANRQGQSGDARMTALTSDAGYFTFFMESNVEGVLKVLDGCGTNNHYWVFVAGLTNVEVDLTVVDTLTGETAEYFNPLRNPFETRLDTRALATCGEGGGNVVAEAGAAGRAGEGGLGDDELASMVDAELTPEMVSRLMPELASLSGKVDAGQLAGRSVVSRSANGLDILDLADIARPDEEVDAETISREHVLRIYGSSRGEGRLGVPVAGGMDVDADGEPDAAMASFLSSPEGRDRAGEVFVYLSRNLGRIDSAAGDFSTDTVQRPVLRILGAARQETAGSEIWIDDVTGDGVGDVLICRQNHSPSPGRPGTGALTILPGGVGLSSYAASDGVLDLANPSPLVAVTTLVGAESLGRFCMWVRTGDVDGDGTADLVIGADQESAGATHSGSVYVIRGGGHLAGTATLDLAGFDAGLPGTVLAGRVARILPPPMSEEYHLGATTAVGDLDGNGRAEVMMAAALARGGASVPAEGQPASTAHSSGGSPGGTMFIAWDDNFPAGAWPDGFTLTLGDLPGGETALRGRPGNRNFGEEMLAGGDWDGDGLADLYAGDLTADVTFLGTRPFSGMGMVFYDASALRGLAAAVDALPAAVETTLLIGAEPGDIAGDTAVTGDFDGDGTEDLLVSSPHATVEGRESAGTFHILHGQTERWPELIDLAQPPIDALRMSQVLGANGATGIADQGDTIAYSMAVGDMDRDGRPDLLFNEMLGNGDGFEAPTDVGNLVILSGRAFSDGGPCVPGDGALCLRGGRFRVTATWRLADGVTGEAVGRAITDEAGYFVFFRDSNLELLVKVLDGCAINYHYWVFTAGLTNVGVQLVVEDLANGAKRTYYSRVDAQPPFQPDRIYRTVQNTQAFRSCDVPF